ncbi:MAG TPA: amino acid permease [Terrimesophilobacter sp.]|uniref:APC family permease n=1 Tax=Terrimesophilobacter sp. TaxID=2906435 RepID=UPI002F923377
MSMSDQAARDAADLEKFGYKQELKRGLGTFSSFAVAFSYISPSTGIFTLFFLGMSALGGFLFWTWPVVALFQLIVALNFAELSSHFPVAGSVFQWTKYLAGRTYAWFTGWFYVFAGILTVASVCATLPIALLPALNSMFGWSLNTDLGSADQRVTALITLALITILNIYGVRLVAIVNNTGVVFEILGMVVFAIFLAIVHNNQGVGVIFDSDKSGNIFQFPAPLSASFFLVGMFMSLYVIYGFDTASTLAEETRNPRAEAPKAVIASVIGSFVIGAIFLWGVLIAVPDMGEAVSSFATGPQQVIEAVMSSAGATLYLLVVSAAIFVCCMSILTSTIRLAFGMARDDQLPFSKSMARVSPRLHTPIWTCVIVGALAAVPFIQFAGAAVIAVGATASIYFSYLLGNFAVMRARTKGWPRTKAPFSLGRWGKLVNIVAILWGLAMLLNFLTPSSASSAFDPNASGANYMRIISNPKPVQTDYYVEGEQLVDFKIDFLNKIPVIWTVFSLILIGGAIYYLAAQRKKPWEPVVPTDEDLSGIVSIE